jgi:hypothetical protein
MSDVSRGFRQVYEIVPEGNGWAIWSDGNGLIARAYWKSEAVEVATQHALRTGPSRLLIFRADGSLEADHLYGSNQEAL